VKTSALDCLARGLHSLRANWELVPLVWLQQFLVMLLSVASVIAFLLPFGLGTGTLQNLGAMNAQELEGWLADAAADLPRLLPALSLGLLASLLVGLLAFLVFCWFQAGVIAVLTAGERQALPGAPRNWRLFRTFEGRAFTAWAARYSSRFFWFYNLYLLVVSGLVLVWALVAVLAGWAWDRWGVPAAVGIGCGASLPLVFLLLVTVGWFCLAQADLARDGASVRIASRRALDVLARRWPGLLLLLAVYFGFSLLVGFGTAPLSLVLPQPLSDGFAAYCLGQVVLIGFQVVVSSVANLAFLGAMVAMMQSELRQAAGSPAEPPLPVPPAGRTGEALS